MADDLDDKNTANPKPLDLDDIAVLKTYVRLPPARL